MQERFYFWIGIALTFVGLGMPVALPHLPPWIGYAILILALAAGLRALQHWMMKPQTASNSPPKHSINVQGDANKVSIGHLGDVTFNAAPTPELRIGHPRFEIEADGTHRTTYAAEVISPYPAGMLTVEAWGTGITGVQIIPQRSGVVLGGPRGVRPDHAFATLIQPFGRNNIVVHSSTRTEVELRWSLE
jgi:hypothetical protein